MRRYNLAGGAGAPVSPAAAAHLLGAPWPGACAADGNCTLAAAYGGTLGRWVFNASAISSSASPAGGETTFGYEAGEPQTCEMTVGKVGRCRLTLSNPR